MIPLSGTCNKSVKSRSDLFDRENVRLILRLYRCDNCDKYFKSKSVLVRHKKIHASLRSHVCDTCNKSFKDRRNLCDHRAVHSTFRPYACDSCEKSFKLLKTLNTHKKIHSRRYECNDCDKVYSYKAQLFSHMSAHYSTSKLYVCDDCGLPFLKQRYRNQHKRLTHSTLRHKCDKCHKSFKYQTSLRHHERAHLVKLYARNGREQHGTSTFRSEIDIDSHLERQRDESNREASDTSDSSANADVNRSTANRDCVLLSSTRVSRTQNRRRDSNKCKIDDGYNFAEEQYLYDLDEMLQQYSIDNEVEINSLEDYLFSTDEKTLLPFTNF